MAQLLIFAKDHSQDSGKISAQQLAGLFQVGDLICWRPFERITDISWADGFVTIETESPHHIRIGMPIRVSGVVPEGFNGEFKALDGTEGIAVVFELEKDPGKPESLGTVGWPWSVKELKDPLFRILEWHGKDPAELDLMLRSRTPAADAQGKTTSAFIIRERKYDILQTDQSIKDFFADTARLEEKLDVTAVPLDSAVVIKTDVPLGDVAVDPVA